VSQLTGGCTTKCNGPNGGLFCDGQYIDIDAIDDCTFSLSLTTTTTGSLSTNCAAAPAQGSRSGLPAALGALAGIGLFVARRRRRA
jgi:MYXO-CTERM domain-containing protein